MLIYRLYYNVFVCAIVLTILLRLSMSNCYSADFIGVRYFIGLLCSCGCCKVHMVSLIHSYCHVKFIIVSKGAKIRSRYNQVPYHIFSTAVVITCGCFCGHLEILNSLVTYRSTS